MTTPAVLVPQGDPLAPTESLAPTTPTARTFHEKHGTGPLGPFVVGQNDHLDRYDLDPSIE